MSDSDSEIESVYWSSRHEHFEIENHGSVIQNTAPVLGNEHQLASVEENALETGIVEEITDDGIEVVVEDIADDGIQVVAQSTTSFYKEWSLAIKIALAAVVFGLEMKLMVVEIVTGGKAVSVKIAALAITLVILLAVVIDIVWSLKAKEEISKLCIWVSISALANFLMALVDLVVAFTGGDIVVLKYNVTSVILAGFILAMLIYNAMTQEHGPENMEQEGLAVHPANQQPPPARIAGGNIL